VSELELSVVVPARNAAPHLRQCLAALRACSDVAREVIVVDDASDDDDRTAGVAREAGARLLSTPRRGGPGAARNLGARSAGAPLLLFVDADVLVRPDTLARVRRAFAEEPGLCALFGSYDTTPSDPGPISQFKNLVHHHVHQQGSARASTFWAGCGAVRRELFLAMGGFDESYGRPSIEDIELGVRLVRAGHAIALLKDLQVTHLKRWTLPGLLRSDLLDRAIPWTELILRERRLPADLNLKPGQRLAALCAVALLGALLLAPLWPPALLAGALALGLLVLLNLELLRFFARQRGLGFTVLVALPLQIAYYLWSLLGLGLGVLHFLSRRGRT
jgi:glycosyltransferase involved in cell wall biosynthesis